MRDILKHINTSSLRIEVFFLRTFAEVGPFLGQDGTYAMNFLKWNGLNQNCSGCVYHREIINIAYERPLKTIYATFFTFWVVAL